MERYRLVERIKQGSKGEVWLVKGSYSQKQYVLKQVNLQHVSKREQRAAHLEVKLLSTLKHPNIVSYLDSFHNSKGNLFIVMRYCENGDLYSKIRNQNEVSFPEKQIIEWLIQICMGLKYLHDRNILHRDLKTQNLFLTRSKLIKIGNFGIARVLGTTNEMTSTLIRTHYTSPEIFYNKPFNHKSDVWALGCCVYEMVSLNQTFYAKNLNSLISKILHGKVSKLSKQYSRDLLEIIATMLSHNPEDRPSVMEILLSSYIRSCIVQFLEKTQFSSKIGLEKHSKLKRRAVGDYDAGDNPKKNGEFENQDGLPAMEKINERRNDDSDIGAMEVMVAIPDINGNGDGNDNSQYRFIAYDKSNVKTDFDECTCSKNVQNQISSENKIKCKNINNHVHTEVKPKTHKLPRRMWVLNKMKNAINFNIEDKNFPDNQNLRIKNKNIKSVCTDLPKDSDNCKNGQNCFKFLQNLEYSVMKSSRHTYNQLPEAHAQGNSLPFIDADNSALMVSVQSSSYAHDGSYPALSSHTATKLKSQGSKKYEISYRCPKICLKVTNEMGQYNKNVNIIRNSHPWENKKKQ